MTHELVRNREIRTEIHRAHPQGLLPTIRHAELHIRRLVSRRLAKNGVARRLAVAVEILNFHVAVFYRRQRIGEFEFPFPIADRLATFEKSRRRRIVVPFDPTEQRRGAVHCRQPQHTVPCTGNVVRIFLIINEL